MIKRENLLLLIGLLVMAAMSVGLLIIYQNFVPTTKLDKLFGTKVILKNETLVNDDEAGIIQKRSDAYSTSGKMLAVIYEVRVFTTDFGDPELPHLDLYIGIDENDKVYVTDIVINQTADFIPLVKDYILKNYAGIYYENVQFVDGSAGATTIYDSRGAIKSAVMSVIEYHYGEDPLAVFNQSYDTSLEITIEGGIKYPLNYKGENLVIYKVAKEGPYVSNQGLQTGSIMVYIAVDQTGVIKYVGLPTELYNHSHGGFYNSVASALSILVENEVDITSQDFLDYLNTVPAGVTGSGNLVNEILTIIVNDYDPNSVIPTNIFTANYDTSTEEVVDEGIKYRVNFNGEDYTVYKIAKVGNYFRGSNEQSGSIMVYVAIDSNNIIKYVELPEDLYEHSGGNFYNNVLNNFNSLVESEMNITSQDFLDYLDVIPAGVTGSSALVNEILAIIGLDYDQNSVIPSIFTVNYDISMEETVDEGIKYQVRFNSEDYTVYKIAKVGNYFRGSSEQSGSIMVYVAIDSNNIIKYVELPEDLYDHSGGNFYNNVLSNFNNLVESEMNITSQDFLDYLDVIPAGVTGSSELVNEILAIIGEDVNNASGN